MVSESLPMSIKIFLPVKYWYLVDTQESLYTWVIIWVNTIQDHIDTRAICLGIKVLWWYINPNDIENKNILKYSNPTGINECNILIIITQIGPQKHDTSQKLEQTYMGVLHGMQKDIVFMVY